MMSLSSSHAKIDKNYYGNTASSLGCSNSSFCSLHKWSTKRFWFLFQIILIMWLLALTLTYFTKEREFKIYQKPRNVFEEFNSHKSIFRGLNILQEYDYSFTSKNLTKIQSKIEDKRQAINMEKYRIKPNPFMPSADCRQVVKGNSNSIEKASLLKLALHSKSNEKKFNEMKKFNNELSILAKNCSNFRLIRKYIDFPLTAEEQAYPIAYIITIHNNLEMFERLLRAIYHPQNLYCVHVDKKSPQEFLDSVKQLSGCFENVFVASNLTDVHYTHWSRVEADLNCFHDLVKKSTEVKWKYVLNLCGLDFPLKTNLEIVRSLKALRGYNNIESIEVPSHKKRRYEFHYELPSNNGIYATMEKTDIKKDPSPLDTPMFAGSAYYIWKREAVEFMLRDPTVRKFFSWNQDSYSPDEHVWATLQRWYPHMPGSSPPHPKYDLNELQTIVRLVKWGGLDTSVYPKCSGRFMRGVCVYGVGDLSWLLQQRHLFANKFDSDFDPYAIECLDLWLRNRTIIQSTLYHSKGFI